MPGAVHERVDPAEALHRDRAEAAGVGRVRHVGRDRHGATPARLDRFDDLGGGLGNPVRDRDGGSVQRETLGDGSADPLARSRHDRHSPLEPSIRHARLLSPVVPARVDAWAPGSPMLAG